MSKSSAKRTASRDASPSTTPPPASRRGLSAANKILAAWVTD